MPALHILWRDEHLVAVYKPAGWLVHRTGLDAGETRFVMQTLRDQLGRHVYPVHRLDKGTCGVLVMALHPDAARALSQSFERHAVRKDYLALVRGWAPPAMNVDHPLRPDDAPPDAPVQEARTALRCLARLEWPESADPRFATTRASLVHAMPETGRRHQIRRHLKHIAHPIIGDATHGKGPLNRWWAERLGGQRLWLHAWRLQVPHPVTGDVLMLHSGLPAQGERAGGAPHPDGPADMAGWMSLWQRGLWQAAEAPQADPGMAPCETTPTLRGAETR